MFELLDLFMRDSTLGQFNGRLKLISFLARHFSHKQSTLTAVSKEKVRHRLTKLVNALCFVQAYYSQF